MGWLPIVSVKEFFYPRIVKCFYCNMKFEDEGPITTSINGVPINFDVAELCKILDIPNEGVCLYEGKKWPRVKGFKVAEAMQRLCGYPKFGRPTSHSFTVLSRILQHMISYISSPKEGIETMYLSWRRFRLIAFSQKESLIWVTYFSGIWKLLH